jgi:lipoyl(octanoyl) transferase
VKPGAQAFRFNRPVPYQPAAEAMERLVDARLANAIPDTVLFLEHQPVVTLGSRGSEAFLLKKPAELAAEGVHVSHASRGGDITFHGPGQLVLYPILALGPSETDMHRYLSSLEEVALRTCADFGVTAFRVPGKTGAWTDKGKLAAIGVRVRRWTTSHGMSFNIDIDLRYTSWIVPCGLVGQPVTTLRQHLGEACPSLAAVRERMRLRFAEVMNRTLEWSDAPLPAALQDLAAYRD